MNTLQVLYYLYPFSDQKDALAAKSTCIDFAAAKTLFEGNDPRVAVQSQYYLGCIHLDACINVGSMLAKYHPTVVICAVGAL